MAEENKDLEKKGHHQGHHHHHHKDGKDGDKTCCLGLCKGFSCHCGDRGHKIARVLIAVFLGLVLFSLGVNVGTKMIIKYHSRMEFYSCSHRQSAPTACQLKNPTCPMLSNDADNSNPAINSPRSLRMMNR